MRTLPLDRSARLFGRACADEAFDPATLRPPLARGLESSDELDSGFDVQLAHLNSHCEFDKTLGPEQVKCPPVRAGMRGRRELAANSSASAATA